MKAKLLWAVLITHKTATVWSSNLSTTPHFSRIDLLSDGRSQSQRLPPFLSTRSAILSVRGGASEPGRSAWTAGSKYDYGTNRPNNYSTSSPTAQSYRTAAPYNQDTKEDETKEAFAEAFQKRDDRNRFIGKCKYIRFPSIKV